MWNKVIFSFLIILCTQISFASMTNNGMVYVPYRDMEKKTLDYAFSSAKPLSAAYMMTVEYLIEEDPRVFIIEDSYERSTALNILAFASSVGPTYNAALLTIDYTELQDRVCDANKDQSTACLLEPLDIKKLVRETSEDNGITHISLTPLGVQILLPLLQESNTNESFTSITERVPGKQSPAIYWGFYFSHSESVQTIAVDTTYTHTNTTEVRVKNPDFFITKTEPSVTNLGITRKIYENIVYAKFPIKNKINLRGQQ